MSGPTVYFAALRSKASLLLILIAAALMGCSAPTAGRELNGVGNVGKVQRRDEPASFFFRGNQPSEEGIATLKQMGVKTVINLRDNFDPREEQWARDAGMEYLLIKTSCREIKPLQIAAFMSKMREYQKGGNRWPVFIHCFYGRDRTGLYVAIHRIVDEGWDREAAIDELLSYGHRPKQPFGCPAIVPYLREFDPAQFRGR